MSREIDERIVQMTFNNQQFERGARVTLGTLDKLKRSLKFEDTATGLEEVQHTLNRLDFSNLLSGSTAAIAKFTMISNLVTNIQHKAEAMVKSLTIDPVKSGWQKYADITTATQTIMSATASDYENQEVQMEAVNEQLAKLNWFTDETSYSLTDMTNNIGKFTSAGVKLEEATEAMIGISTWAGKSGAGIQQASRAMYNLSQAMGTGAVKLQDWMSIENANMATKEFKQTVIDTAISLGKLEKREDGVYITGTKALVTAENFRENLKQGWFTSDVLVKTLHTYGDFTTVLHEFSDALDDAGHYMTTSKILEAVDEYSQGGEKAKKVIDELTRTTGLDAEFLTKRLETLGSNVYKLGRESFVASQEAKTFSEAIEATKDAVSTGWMNSFKLVFGDYLEAKKVWTRLANELWEVFAAPGERRNGILEVWIEGKGRDHLFKAIENLWKPIIESIQLFRDIKDEFFPVEEIGKSLAIASKRLEDFTSKIKMNEKLVHRVSETVFRFANTIKNVLKPIGTLVSNLANSELGKIVAALSGILVLKGRFGMLGVALTLFSDKISIVSEKLSNTFAKVASSGIGKGFKWLNEKIEKLKEVFASWWKNLQQIKLPDWVVGIINWFKELFTPVEVVEEAAEAVEEHVEKIETAYKSIKEMVLEVIRGDWGNGIDRDNALWAAGYDNDRIQDVVNQVWSLQGDWKEGYEEILNTYENVSALMEGSVVAGDPEAQKNVKKTSKILQKTGRVIADIADYGEKIKEAFDEGLNDDKKAKNRVKFLKKTGQIVEDVTEDLKDRTFLQILKDGGNKFIAKLPEILTKLGKAAASAKIKMAEFGKILNEKLGRAVERLIQFWAKWGPMVKNFMTELWEKIKSFGSGAIEKFGAGWERLKSVFSGLSPVFEKFFTALLSFDLKGMGQAILDFFGTIGENIKNGVETALGLGQEGLSKIGGLFSDVFDGVMVLFGGKTLENTGEETGFLAKVLSIAEQYKETTTEMTAELEDGEVPSQSLLTKISESFDGLFGILQGGASILTTFRLGTMLKGLGKAGKGLGNMGDSIGEFFQTLTGKKGLFKKDFWGNLKDVMSVKKRISAVEAIKDILLAVAAVAGAVIALGYISPEQLNQGLKAYGDIIAGIIGLFGIVKGGDTLVDVLKKDKGVDSAGVSVNITAFAKAMLALAIAVGVMFFAVQAFAEIPLTKLGKGVLAVIVIMGLLGGALTAMLKLNQGHMEMKGVAAALVGFAIAVGVLFFAVKAFSDIPFWSLAQGIFAVIFLLGGLGTAVGLMNGFGSGAGAVKAAGTIIALAFAVLLLTIPVKVFSTFNIGEFIAGIGGVALMLVALGGAVALINKGSADWAGLLPKLVTLIAVAGLIGALCWAINEWPISIMDAVAIDIVIGGLVGALAGIGALSKLFSDIKSAATSGIGLGLFVGSFVGAIAACFEIVDGVDALVEGVSGGKWGFRSMANKMSFCIEQIGGAISSSVDSISKAISADGSQSALDAGLTAAETLKSIIESVAAMYVSTNDFGLFVAWATQGDVTPGKLMEEAFTSLGPGISALVTSVSGLTKADVTKINLLVPFMNSIAQILIDPAMITDILYFMDQVNLLILRLGDINTDNIDAFEKSMGHLKELFQTSVTDGSAENTGNVLSDALIDFVIYGLDEMVRTFSSTEAIEKYGDAATQFSTKLLDAISNKKAGLERPGMQIPMWIADKMKNSMQPIIDIGYNLMLGLRQGMHNGAGAVFAAAESIALKASDRMKKVLMVKSPSRVTEEIGNFVSLGLAKGILGEKGSVENSATSVVEGMRNVIAMASESLNSDLGPVISPILDLSNIRSGAGTINGLFGNPALNPSLSLANARAISMASVSPNNGFSDTSSTGVYDNVVSAITNVQNEVARLSGVISSMQIVMDSGALVGSIAAPMDNALGKRVVYRSRRN